MKVKFLFLFILIACNVKAHHPVHFTFTNMEIDDEKMQLNYSIRVFQEDILNVLGMLVHEELHKGKSEDDAYKDTTLIPNYFANALKLEIEGKTLTPKLVKQVNEKTEIWLHFSCNLTKIPTELLLYNSIFSELYADHKNMVIFKYNEIEKGLTFNSSTTRQRIALK